MAHSITVRLNKPAREFQAGENIGFNIRAGVQYYDRQTKKKEWTNYSAVVFAKPGAQADYYPVIPDGWISCSERMPEMGERQCYVLAADFKNNYPPSIPNTQVGVYGDWFNDGNPTWDDGDGEDLHLKEVTHWMPLPEPPRLKEL